MFFHVYKGTLLLEKDCKLGVKYSVKKGISRSIIQSALTHLKIRLYEYFSNFGNLLNKIPFYRADDLGVQTLVLLELRGIIPLSVHFPKKHGTQTRSGTYQSRENPSTTTKRTTYNSFLPCLFCRMDNPIIEIFGFL